MLVRTEKITYDNIYYNPVNQTFWHYHPNEKSPFICVKEFYDLAAELSTQNMGEILFCTSSGDVAYIQVNDVSG